MTITNNAIKMMNNGVGRCPHCKKFFGTKKLSEETLALVNKFGVCPACIKEMNLEEEKSMENVQEIQAADVEQSEVKEAEVVTAEAEVKEKKVAKKERPNTVIVPEDGDDRLIIAGPRGVTKHQMIPAIVRNIENPENIKRLADEYPATFTGSLRYVKKNIRDAVAAIIGDIDNDTVDEEKFALLQILKPERKGVTYHQVIPALENAAENGDYAMINKIKKYFPEQFRGSLKYMAKKYHDALETAMKMETNEEVSIKKMAARA